MEENPEKYFNDGVWLCSQNDFRAAILSFEKAINLNHPELSKAWHGKGNALCELGSHDEALDAYDKAIELNEEFVPTWRRKGDVLFDLGSYDKAVNAYVEAIRLYQKYAPTWSGKGNEAIMNREYVATWSGKGNEAIMNREYVATWSGMGNALNGLGRYDEAKDACDEAIKLNQVYAPTWSGKGNALCGLGHYKEAMACYDEAIELDPENAYPRYGRGMAFKGLGSDDEAMDAYDKAIELDPKFAHPWYGKGVIFLENSPGTAICCFRRFYFLLTRKIKFFKFSNEMLRCFQIYFTAPLFVHRIFQDIPILYTYQRFASLAADTEEQCEEALLMLKFLESRQDFPLRVENLKLRGLIHYYFGDPEISKTVFERIDDLDDSDLMGQYYLILSMDGYLENRDQELRFAVEKAKEALDKKSDNPENLYYAGLILLLAKDEGNAEQAFRAAPGSFLPTLYMQTLMARERGDDKKTGSLMEEILHQEALLREGGGKGFLGEGKVWEINIDKEGWEAPIIHYARSMEIREGVEAVYDWLDAYRTQQKSSHPLAGKIAPGRTEMKEAFEAWRLAESTRAALEESAGKINPQELEVRRAGLKKYFTLLEEMGKSQDVEAKIALEIQRGDIVHQAQKFKDLVVYFFLEKKINSMATVLLHAYLTWLFLKKRGLKEYDEKVVTGEYFGIAGSILLSLTPVDSAKIMGAGCGGFAMICKYLHEILVKKINENIPYGEFKENFIQYAHEMKGNFTGE